MCSHLIIFFNFKISIVNDACLKNDPTVSLFYWINSYLLNKKRGRDPDYTNYV